MIGPLALSAASAVEDQPQGVSVLSSRAFEVLTLTGAYLAQIPPTAEALPAPYVIGTEAQNPVLRQHLADEEAWTGLLPHLDRLAGQGMHPLHIAQRLALPLNAFREAYNALPAVRLAMTAMARMIDLASATVVRNAEEETTAAIFLLKTRGFFETTKKSDPAPAVHINVGGPAALDLSAIASMRERQEELTRIVDYDSLLD
jgi:hypothetical protein